MDIQVGDVVRFTYKRFGTQIIASADVVEVLPDNRYILKITEGQEVEVDYKHIVERYKRPSEFVQVEPTPVDPEEILNKGITGVRFKRRLRNGNKENESRS